VEPELACEAFARSCCEALGYDASIPRPGLSSATRPKRDPDPSALLAAAPRAYRACLESCRAAASGLPSVWIEAWHGAVVDLASRGWGNPAMGSLFLLSLQAASLGYTVSKTGSDRVEHVMGSSRALVEAVGVRGAQLFYDALLRLRPSYLGRLSWAGLPDASTSLGLWEVFEKRITLSQLLDRASLYDPVSRDAARQLQLSLGEILPVLSEQRCRLGEAVVRATLYALASAGDFLAFRKGGVNPRGLALEAYGGSAAAEAKLWGLLRGSAIGSTADLVVSALARLLYEAETGRLRVSFIGC
jgi:triphosphoribosyl-dephospho-CoA synthetase